VVSSIVFKKHKVDLVVMEACGPSGWIKDLATSFGLETLVCSTNEDAWKWSNVKRTRQYQTGETDRNGRITKRGNPFARTILVECAWASLRYNPWASAVYERISGKQKTRKKKAAVALARKISVIAWALLRDDKDWEPKRMIEVTESFGKIPEALKVTLQNMKPKENSDQRKSRLRKEARMADTATDDSPKKTSKTDSKAKLKPKADQTSTPTTPKPRRARKPVARSVARA
jgi:transposase